MTALKKSTLSASAEFKEGFRDGIPIGLGYFAVSFALGIAMRNAGLSWLDGFFMSLLNLASAGEYAGTQVIASAGGYVQMGLMTLIANARYLLMSTALSQKLSEDTGIPERVGIGYAITDELFGIAIARNGYLAPAYFYGGMAASVLPWAVGTSLGIVTGNILPVRIVSALGVALYGMFLAIIIPPSKKDRTVLKLVIAGFVLSWLASKFFASVSGGTRIIILTVLLAGLAAYFKPIDVKEEEE